MATIDKNETSDLEPNNNLEKLYQEFGDGSFYGLEYIIDDLFQNISIKPSISSQSSIDWFGLYD